MHPAQAQVEKNQRGCERVESHERFFGRGCDVRFVAEIAYRLGQPRRESSVVFNDQDFGHGSSISKRAPFLLSTQRSKPPCASTISRAMLKPSPAPSSRVLTNGSKIFWRASSAIGAPEFST